MLRMASLLIALTVVLQPDTTVVLGLVGRDLTGDGKPEILRVLGVGPTIDNLEATFTVESAGTTLYRFTFTFSPGGDAIVAIGWSARAGRFYRLLECC